MGHHGREAAIGRGHCRQAAGRSIGIERVLLGGLAVVVHIAHGGDGLVRIAAEAEVGKAFAVGHGDGQAAAGHALQEQAGRLQHFHHGQARLEAIALVLRETRPVLGTGNDVGQLGKHLAAVAHAQAEGVAAAEELLELRGQAVVEGDGARPADAGAQSVAVAEAAAGHHAGEVLQLRAAALQVGHVHVHRVEAGLGEGVGHFHMGVHALLAQHGHAGARAQVQEGCGGVLGRVERQVQVHARVGRLAGCGVLAVGAGRVVALLGNLPADGIPDLVQVAERGAEDGLGIAPDLQFALARIDLGGDGARLADDVAAGGQAMLAQGLQHGGAVGRADLQHGAQLFVEQCAQRHVVAAAADLGGPVLAFARVHAAVADAVAFGDQHVHVDGHAHMAGKGHLGHGGQQAAVALVVVGQDLALGAQVVDGIDQGDQVLGVIEVRRFHCRTGPAPGPGWSRPCASCRGPGPPGPGCCRLPRRPAGA